MEKDIIQSVNISILNDMIKEQEQKYEKEIAKLKTKIKVIKIYCETKLEPCKTCIDLDCENKYCGDYKKACKQILEIEI